MKDNNLSCVQADMQKEVFDNLCKDKWDRELQLKFGEYADVVCNTKATIDGGETYLTLGIYDITDNLVNFSEELSSLINLSNGETRELIEQYLDIFNLSADVDWNEESEKAEISISMDEPYIDEFTEDEVINIIKNEEKMLISEKLADCLEKFIHDFMHNANLDFGYRWQEWTLSNPETI